MATLMQTDVSAGPGILQGPLLLVSGAVHAFRAFDRLREVASTAASQRTAAHTESFVRNNHHNQHNPHDHLDHQQDLLYFLNLNATAVATSRDTSTAIWKPGPSTSTFTFGEPASQTRQQPSQRPLQQQQQQQQRQELDNQDKTATATVMTGLRHIAESDAEGSSLLRAATILASAVSRTAAQVAIHPLDTLKTRMQVRLPTPQLRVWRAVMSCPATRPRALAAWAGAAGARDIMLGLGASVAGVLPSSALYFAAEPLLRSWLGCVLGTDREDPLCRLAASASAASLSALIRVPADVIKHRVQAYAFPSSSHALRAILVTHGPSGLYAGFGATLLRDAPEIVIQFTVYRQLKAQMEHRRASGGSGDGATAAASAAAVPTAAAAAEHLLLGGAAGAAATLATTPLDVIKTQLQCGSATSVPTAVAQVLRTSGPVGLFGGLTPRLLQATLCSAMFFTCFEASKAQLEVFAAGGTPGPAAKALPPPPPPAVATVLLPEAAMVLRPSPQGWLPLPPVLSPVSPRQRRSGVQWRSDAPDGGGGADYCSSGGLWGAGGALIPVALYAYTYAGAAAPAPAPAAGTPR